MGFRPLQGYRSCRMFHLRTTHSFAPPAAGHSPADSSRRRVPGPPGLLETWPRVPPATSFFRKSMANARRRSWGSSLRSVDPADGCGRLSSSAPTHPPAVSPPTRNDRPLGVGRLSRPTGIAPAQRGVGSGGRGSWALAPPASRTARSPRPPSMLIARGRRGPRGRDCLGFWFVLSQVFGRAPPADRPGDRGVSSTQSRGCRRAVAAVSRAGFAGARRVCGRRRLLSRRGRRLGLARTARRPPPVEAGSSVPRYPAFRSPAVTSDSRPPVGLRADRRRCLCRVAADGSRHFGRAIFGSIRRVGRALRRIGGPGA